MKITADYLRKMGACSSSVRIFERFFPKGAKPTLKNIRQCRILALDWFAENCLTTPAYHEYEEAIKPEYDTWHIALSRGADDEEELWEKLLDADARALYHILKRGKKVLKEANDDTHA
jgi:hypothetical protein